MPYQAKNFENLIGLPGFSEKILKDHFGLYQGYVNNFNKLDETLMAMEKEDSQELAWFFGFQELLESRSKNYEEIIKKIDLVEKSDIKRVALKLFSQEFYLALVGQGDENKLLKLIS